MITFSTLPWDCIYHICEECTLKTLENIYHTNKIFYMNKNIIGLLEKKLSEEKAIKLIIRKDYLDRYFGIKHAYGNWIQELFGDKLLTAPILEWKNCYLGSTSYIDSIHQNDVKGDFVIGVDPYNRSFFVLREKHNRLVTFFKRYDGDTSFTWCSASGHEFGYAKLRCKIITTYGYADSKFKKLLYKYANIFKDDIYYPDDDSDTTSSACTESDSE